MPDAADLAQQLADEDRAKQRQYVLTNTRARWSFVAVGVALLGVLRLARWAPVPWWFIVAFAVVFVAANYAMLRVARDAAFRPWYAHLNIAVGAALISVVLAAVGPTGHALYVAYLIAPLQAALYLGRTEAWQALILNLTGFALVTAIRAGAGIVRVACGRVICQRGAISGRAGVRTCGRSVSGWRSACGRRAICQRGDQRAGERPRLKAAWRNGRHVAR
jgi:hypothetical protein